MTPTRQTLAATVYEKIRQDIMLGVYSDGDQINQVQLAAKYGVSRVPVREAIQRLLAEGLLTGNAYRRVEIAPVSIKEVQELLDIRETLEIMALRRMFRDYSGWSTARAHELNRLFATEEDLLGRMNYDCQFHEELMNAMPAAVRIIRDVRTRTNRYVERLRILSSPRSSGWDEHEAILRAIENRQEVMAIELLRSHIDVTRQTLLKANSQVAPSPAKARA